MSNQVIIIGKPNVGKSSIFNGIINKKMALVDNYPGLTRDIRKKKIRLWDKELELIDSPGLVLSKNQFEKNINASTLFNAKLSCLILLVFDSKDDLTSEDHYIINLTRKLNKKTLVVMNKCDIKNYKTHDLKGFEKKFFISATHNSGLDDLKWEIYNLLENNDKIETEDQGISVAIVGKINTGKSTIFNLLSKKAISQISEVPFMTRDAVESDIDIKNIKFRAFDTAGFSKGIESRLKVNQISIEQTLKKIRLSQVIVIVLDVNNYFEKINSKIIDHVFKENRCVLILVNKIDTQSSLNKRDIIEHIYYLTPQIKDIPICFVSAIKNLGFETFYESLLNQLKSWKNRISTSNLNIWLSTTINKTPHPMYNGNLVKFKFITQVSIAPPKFFIFTNHPKFISNSYKRFLANNLKNNFNLAGLPAKIVFKKSSNPYEKK
jgi:GTP-binding protein